MTTLIVSDTSSVAVPLTDFLPEVLPFVSGCTAAFATNAVRNAAREFCRRTRLHKVFLQSVSITADTASYPFGGMPPQTEVVRIESAILGATTELEFREQDWFPDNYATDWERRTGTPRFITQDDEENFLVVPYPTENLTEQLTLRVSLQPTEDAIEIARVIFRRYKTKIASGAIAMLMLTQNTPYYNTEQAAVHVGLFGSAIGDVNWRAFKGHVRARPRIRGHYF